MDSTWIAALAGTFTTVVSGISSWILAKRKYNAEVDNTLIQNMKESLDFYKALADDNKARLDEVLQENADLRAEVGELRCQVSKLTDALAQFGLQRLLEEQDNPKKE